MIVPLTFLLQLATFNVRGLVKEEKQSLLDVDCTNYGLHLIALQETNVTSSYEVNFKSNNKLFFMKQTSGRHGGLGFMVSKTLAPYVLQTCYVSGMVVYI